MPKTNSDGANFPEARRSSDTEASEQKLQLPGHMADAWECRWIL